MFNPDSGPGSVAYSGYTTQLAKNKAAGKQTYGYLGTGYFCAPSTASDPTAGSPYADRCPLATIKAGIDKWLALYPGIDGIFFDEADSGKYAGSKDTKAKWEEILAYAKSKGLKAIINFGNDGFDDSLAGLDAIILNFEGDAAKYLATTFTHTGSKYFHIVYGVADSQIQAVADKANANAGYVHITNFAQQSGAYSQLPTSWTAITNAINGSTGSPTNSGGNSSGSGSSSGSSSSTTTSPPAEIPPPADVFACDEKHLGTPGLQKLLNCQPGKNPIYSLIQALVNWLIGIFGSLAVLAIIIGGIQYSSSGGNPEAIRRAKSHIVNAVVGVIMLILMFFILKLIGVN